MDSRLSPSPSPSSGSLDDNVVDSDAPAAIEQVWRPQEIPNSPIHSNKRRAQAGPSSMPYPKVRNKRGEDNTRYPGGSGNGGSGRGPENKKDELVDAELARSLRRAIGDPFDESTIRYSS